MFGSSELHVIKLVVKRRLNFAASFKLIYICMLTIFVSLITETTFSLKRNENNSLSVSLRISHCEYGYVLPSCHGAGFLFSNLGNL